LIIDIYFYETFSTQTSSACTLKNSLDILSNILDKCFCFSLIKIESVSINPSQAMLGALFSSVVYTFRLKMPSLVLIKNCNSFVYLIWILRIKLDLKQETHFTIYVFQYFRRINTENLFEINGIATSFDKKFFYVPKML
jgi:hypothetical protein